MPAEEKRDQAYWRQKALAGLPPEEEVIARNKAITGTYAAWYIRCPEVLKWAGMAAFASHRVGLALQPYRIKFLDNAIMDIEEDETYADSEPKALTDSRLHLLRKGKESVLQGLNLIRETNNCVYRDIGWAHVAYLSRQGGLAALEAELADQPSYERLLTGFRLLDQGRQMLTGSPQQKCEARKLIWEGNELLLEHEQLHTVQNQFEKLDAAFDLFLSFATVMSFNYVNLGSRELYINPFKLSSFRLFLWLFGLGLLARTHSRPDIVRADHRWYWVRRRVLPLWKWVEERDKMLPDKMEKLKGGANL